MARIMSARSGGISIDGSSRGGVSAGAVSVGACAMTRSGVGSSGRPGVGASGVNFFPGPDGYSPEQARDLILLQNLRAALDLLAGNEFAAAFGNSTDLRDYRWGYLHRIELDHLLGGPFSIPSAGGFSHFG